MTPQRAFKVRSFVNGVAKSGNEHKHYSLTVPRSIAEQIPDDMTFVPRMTEEGILYEPQQHEPEEPPSWLQAKSNGNSQKKSEKSEEESNVKQLRNGTHD